MYSKFNYTPSRFYNKEINPHLTKGSSLYSNVSEEARKCLEEFIYTNGHVDGSSLQTHWFKAINADVFISHSHKDINIAKALSGWLYNTFKLTSFIDSCVWGYCNDLLKQIDDMYCQNLDKKTYDYSLRNYTTSHVHVMLSTALMEMIDKTECIIFVNTPESITIRHEIDNVNNSGSVTNSPWIYYELSMTTMVKRTVPIRKPTLIEHRADTYSKVPSFDYNVEKYLKDMITLHDDDLIRWKEYCSSDIHPLDDLYVIKELIKRA